MRLYISGIKPYMDLRGLALVTGARQQRIQAYRRAEDKARCLVAGLLLRQVCGVTDDRQLVYGEHGKPYLLSRIQTGVNREGDVFAPDKERRDMYFSIAHAGDYVILATADTEVGVDIEKVAPYEEAVAARCFTSPEQEWMRQERRDDAFYRLWTAKESVMKAAGLGFALPPETFSVLAPILSAAAGPSALSGAPDAPPSASAVPAAGRSWFLDWLVHDGHIICVASKGGGWKTGLIPVAVSDLIGGA